MRKTSTILITGATDGIGLALAEYYARLGARLVMVGRREEGAELAGEGHVYCRTDLAEADAAQRVAACLRQANVSCLDVLIHNAGAGYYGRFPEQSLANIDQVLDVNLWAPIALTHVLLPWLRRGRGQLVFISSVVSALPGPDYAVYTASKAALDGFARNLRPELAGEVTVQVIHPGATRTGMHAKMGVSPEEMDWRRFPPAAETAVQIAGAIREKRAAATLGVANRAMQLAGRYGKGLIDPVLRRAPERRASPFHAPRVCAITGAAAGIGRTLAHRFGGAGYRIIAIDVNGDGLAEAKAAMEASRIEVHPIEADLASSTGIEIVLSEMETAGPADLFIHNAGVNAVGRFSRLDLARQRMVVDLNLRAPLHLTAELMRRDGVWPGGNWVFLSSLSRYVGYPGAAVYAASKDGLAAFARSLRVANYHDQHVLTVFPGPTRTGHAARYSPDNSRAARRTHPAQVADAIYTAVHANQSRLIPGRVNRLAALAGRIAPGLMMRLMRRAILDAVGEQVLI